MDVPHSIARFLFVLTAGLVSLQANAATIAADWNDFDPSLGTLGGVGGDGPPANYILAFAERLLLAINRHEPAFRLRPLYTPKRSLNY